MQLTNILRDVREDCERGRVYLPAEDLRRFGCRGPGRTRRPRTGSPALIRFEAERATASGSTAGSRWWSCSTAAARSCVLAMTGIYRGILERIELEPAEVLERRISLPAWEKAWVAARSLAGAQRQGGARNGRHDGSRVSRGSRSSAAASPGSRPRSTAPTRGAEVTLLESRRRLGGAAYSFTARRDPAPTTASTCSCAAARRTASCSSGSAPSDARDAPAPARDPGARARAAPRAPAPLRTSPRRCTSPAALIRYRPSACASARAWRAAMHALRRVDPDDPAADARSFGDWLAEHGQSAAGDRRGSGS